MCIRDRDICFTDHVDYGPYRDWDDPRGIQYRPGDEGEPEQVALTNVDYKKYFSMIEKMLSLIHICGKPELLSSRPGYDIAKSRQACFV